MSIGGIGNSNMGMMLQQIQKFTSGKANIQKADIEQAKDAIQKTSGNSGNQFESLLKDFDKIDTNGDGISFKELQNHQKAEQQAQPVTSQQESQPSSSDGKIVIEIKSDKGISKQDLKKIISAIQNAGQKVPGKLKDMLSSFDSIDSNQDGKLSGNEIQNQQNQQANPLKNLFNKIKSGKGISKQDLQNALNSFSQIDSNQDGTATPNEILGKNQVPEASSAETSPNSQLNISDIFSKFVDKLKQNGNTGNVFSAQISQYSRFSLSATSKQFSNVG